MATTTVNVSIDSADLLTDNLGIKTDTTLYQHGTTATGLEQFNYHRAVVPTGTNFDLIQDSAALSDKANYVYIALKNTDETDYVILSIYDKVIGRLYGGAGGGDWAFFPWSDNTTATGGVDDPSGADSSIEIQAVTHDCEIEYMLFHSGETLLTASDS